MPVGGAMPAPAPKYVAPEIAKPAPPGAVQGGPNQVPRYLNALHEYLVKHRPHCVIDETTQGWCAVLCQWEKKGKKGDVSRDGLKAKKSVKKYSVKRLNPQKSPRPALGVTDRGRTV